MIYTSLCVCGGVRPDTWGYLELLHRWLHLDNVSDSRNYETTLLDCKPDLGLSYDIAVIQWITSCHKNRMTTYVKTLWRVDVTSLTTSVSTMRFLIEIMLILKTIKSHFSGSYDKQNLTRVVISSEIYETRRRLVS